LGRKVPGLSKRKNQKSLTVSAEKPTVSLGRRPVAKYQKEERKVDRRFVGREMNTCEVNTCGCSVPPKKWSGEAQTRGSGEKQKGERWKRPGTKSGELKRGIGKKGQPKIERNKLLPTDRGGRFKNKEG